MAIRSWMAAALLIASTGAFGGTSPPPDPNELAAGTRVRASAGGREPVVGTLVSLDEATLAIKPDSGGPLLAIPRAEIQRFEVSTGRSGRGLHAFYGALIGAAAGALIGSNQHSGYGPSKSETTTGVAAIGLLLGAGIGALVPPGEHWREYQLGSHRIALDPIAQRSLGLTVSF